MRHGPLMSWGGSSARASFVGALSLALLGGCGPEEGDADANDDASVNDSEEGGTIDPTTPGTTAGNETNDDAPVGTSGSAGDSTGGDDVSFIETPDGGVAMCDMWTQDCPDGEKCMPWANDGGSTWNATRCSPIDDDPGQPGDECTAEGGGFSGLDTCDLASMCWDVDGETNTGTCVSFCEGSAVDPLCSDPDEVCPITSDGLPILCLPTCDPLLQDCVEGQTCHPKGDGFICFPDASGGMGVFGDPCEYFNECAPGFWCASAESVPGCVGSGGCCASYCNTSAPMSSCEPGTECVSWHEEGTAPTGEEDIGVCVTPA